MNLRWFISGTVRRGTELRNQVWRILNEQRDLLPPAAVASVAAGLSEINALLPAKVPVQELEAQMTKLEKVATSALLSHPNAAVRENVKELLVAVVVILAFSTFFLQLTKIPTGSMQPTLFGIHNVPAQESASPAAGETPRGQSSLVIPNRVVRFVQYWIFGISYFHEVAKADGRLESLDEPKTLFPFVKIQRFRIGGQSYTVWFPPEKFEERAGFDPNRLYRAGEDIFRIRVDAGDHLFVDRFTYNFRKPKRGEIIVFKTKGIEPLPQDQLYIKRLVALGGEKVRIGDDRHLIINGRRIDAADRHFEYLYGGAEKGSHYYIGHVNGTVAQKLGQGILAPRFSTEQTEFDVRPHYYMAMGDNTLNSYDSRAWGDFPEKNVIGKCFFVYWPITSRFGWGYR